MRASATGLIASLTLVLAACSGGTTDPADPAGSTDASDATSGTASGGTLVYATGDAEPTCLDPHVGGNYPQALLASQVLEPLLQRDAEGTITPGLAQEWEVSEDGLTLTLTLAERTFTDGTPVDAEAVAANIAHLQDPDTGSSTGYLAVAKVSEVEAADERTAVLHLSEPDAALLESLTQPWTAIQSPAGLERGMEENCLAPIGTGPFVVAGWTPQQQVDLVRNEDYVPAGADAPQPAALDAITWRFVPDAATRHAALISGEVHVIDNPQPDQIVAAQADEAITHLDAPRPGSVNRIELNGGQAPFDDVAVREAFIRAAGPNPGIETLFAGVAERSYSPLASVEPTAISDPDLFGTDLEAAAALLDEAGWSETDAEGYRTRDGERLTVRFPVSTNQSVAAEQSLFQQIQANAAQVGFEVILEPMDLGSWYAALGANEYEAVSAPYTKVGPDVLRILYHSDSIEPAPSGYFANHAQLDDPALDALLEEASATQDEAARADLMAQAQEIVLASYSILPLYDQQNHFLVRGAQGVTAAGGVSTPSFASATLG
ncbi:ABC transporter substrate-binding protein [Serinibacter salmoneus]|uniref:Peptide/nickel transport system substrate-binding protein n=1 Tax=Serinibacter salmoneus TaxID=556530 RepID=A0A2A9D1C7_9MICO|nr:ABC transporter substrate-binding protein [Serinibacter salmoneus]PFG20191.1 peptide/nickel transport system substrate-binding protein [Serinibacter salmoneus]